MSIPKQGYYLKAGDQIPSLHVIGGKCELDGAISPNSGRPLTQMARLDTTSKELHSLRFATRYLPLLYGWTCAISEGRLCYRVKENSVELVAFVEGGAYDDFPYEGYPHYFEERAAELVKLTTDEQAAIDHANIHGIKFTALTDDLDRVLRPNHQIGGSPYVGSVIRLQHQCHHCEGQMHFVAAIGNDCFGDARGFMGNDYAQLLYFLCDSCYLICAENVCE